MAASPSAWDALNDRIVRCRRCPRLIEHCRHVGRIRRRAYRDESYWARPVPNFGDPRARLLVVGLAPGAHGANRTGRMFTGDRSGDWLYRALHRFGFANQPDARAVDDGLRLFDCAITAACHCAPPSNRPTAEELRNCATWLARTMQIVSPRVIVALGQIAWNAVLRWAVEHDLAAPPLPRFAHGARSILRPADRPDITVLASYHPSQQNTFTGRLTEKMFDEVFRRARRLLEKETPSRKRTGEYTTDRQ
ncbi:MAG: uracil-DNA glycosylase [Planctomycetota bacterium]|nr:MAG: uracil-DNA glycosylase [Planctomycetota bacterium]